MSTRRITTLPRRNWTPGQDEFLRAVHGRMTAAEIARAMCRTASSIYQRCRTLGLGEASPGWDRSLDAEVARLNGEGLSDTEIGRRMGRERHTITRHRKRLGLPDRGHGPQARAAVASGVRRQLERLGISELNQLRVESWRKLARERGWPETIGGRAVCHRHVQILDAIWEHGPQTREQLAARIGMPWKGPRRSMAVAGRPGGSYLAELQRAGLVVRLGRVMAAGGPRGSNKGKSVNLYALALDVEKGAVDVG